MSEREWASTIEDYAIVTFPKSAMPLVANQLMLCSEHHGAHHFAVINEGKSIVLSESAVKCLEHMYPDLYRVAEGQQRREES